MGRKFWTFIIVLALLMLALEYQLPRSFVWKPTFAHVDRQPFGCYVFDSVLVGTMPHGYTVCRKTLSQLAVEKSGLRSIIILRTGYHSVSVNVDTLIALAKRGNHILYANSYFDNTICDTLRIKCITHGDYLFGGALEMESKHDSVFWTGDSLHYKPAVFFCNKKTINSCILPNDSVPMEKLARIHDEEGLNFAREHVSKESVLNENSSYLQRDSMKNLKVTVPDVVALSYPIGKGEIILVTTPLLMTNYGILENPPYVHRLMNRLKDLPVIRTEAYMPNVNASEDSPFRELLERPPLRWALYLTLLGILLLMGFTARRRQRVIPVDEPPRNYQLDFIRRIGTLQYQRTKHDRIWKKLTKEDNL